MSKKIEQQMFKESEVLQMLGITRQTLEKYRLKGYIKYLQIGTVRKYKKEHIDEFLNQFEQ